MNLLISFLLSLLNFLLCLSIPYAVLEKPCDALKSYNLHILYSIVKWIESYLPMIDRLILSVILIIIYISVTILFDAMSNTDIRMSPWVEKGKYVSPRRHRRIRVPLISLF